MKDRLRLRLTVEATYQPNGAHAAGLEERLRLLPARAEQEGLFTGETAAELVGLKVDVEQRLAGPYIIPSNAGAPSTPEAVGRRIGKLFHAMDDVSTWAISKGEFAREVDAFKRRIIHDLTAAGWRVTVTAADRYSVRPPKEEKR